jgi:hypothetical protein
MTTTTRAPHDDLEGLDREYAQDAGTPHHGPNGAAGHAQAGPEPYPVDTITTLLEAAPRQTLVKGFAGRGDLVLFYGPPKQGKTFLVSTLPSQ